MGVGMPETLRLHRFGQIVYDAFGEIPFHVGSSLGKKRGWRDVDVRLILDDEVYESMGLGDPKAPHQNAKWVALALAFSVLGKEMTGLPIDFQIQQRTLANTEFSSKRGDRRHRRSALYALWRTEAPAPRDKEFCPVCESHHRRSPGACPHFGGDGT